MKGYGQELAAVRIQTVWRRYRSIKTYHNELARLERARIVTEAQHQVDLEAQRRRLIYMREVDMYYDKLRRETNQRVADQKRVEEVKFDLRKRKRWKKYQGEVERKKGQRKLEVSDKSNMHDCTSTSLAESACIGAIFLIRLFKSKKRRKSSRFTGQKRRSNVWKLPREVYSRNFKILITIVKENKPRLLRKLSETECLQ